MDPTFIIYTPQAVRILLSLVPLVSKLLCCQQLQCRAWRGLDACGHSSQGDLSPYQRPCSLGDPQPPLSPGGECGECGPPKSAQPSHSIFSRLEQPPGPATQPCGHRSALPASPESLLEIQTLSPCPTPAKSESALSQQPRAFWYEFGCERRCPSGQRAKLVCARPSRRCVHHAGCILHPSCGACDFWSLYPTSQPRVLGVLIPALSTHELLSGLIRMMYMKVLWKP